MPIDELMKVMSGVSNVLLYLKKLYNQNQIHHFSILSIAVENICVATAL